MSRMTLMNVPADQHDVVNAYLVGLFGDDPGSDEIPPNAYADGQDQFTATRCFSTIPLGSSMLAQLKAYFAARTDCLVADYPTTPTQNWWAAAYSLWAILPVAPGP